MAANLGLALKYLFPGADPSRDHAVVESADGQGPRIAKWDTARLGQVPAAETLAAASAAAQADMAALAQAKGELARRVIAVESIEALRSLALRDETIYLLGYWQPGDGGQGIFRWVGGSSLPHNGGTIIEPAQGGSGRWLRICDPKDLDAKWFGARGDGTSDDTAAIQAASDALPPFEHYHRDPESYTDQSGRPLRTGIIRLPAGNYIISDTLHMSFCTRVIGCGLWSYGGTFIRLKANTWPDPGVERWMVRFEHFDRVSVNNLFSTGIEGLTIIDDQGGNEGSSGLHLTGAQGTRIDDVHVYGQALRGAVVSGATRYLIAAEIRRGPGIEAVVGLTAGYIEASHVNRQAAIQPGWGMPWPAIDIRDVSHFSATTLASEANGDNQQCVRIVSGGGISIGAALFNGYGYKNVTGFRIAGQVRGLNIGTLARAALTDTMTLIDDDSSADGVTRSFRGGLHGQPYLHRASTE